eukprot:gnl/TRDRNA2_/TRDRNA2_35952_c0_seq1.p1 gnl/TRDRNA2_/TRDRNA2_35952_c0~~gnl/TRDRNA2_/TRDRNA2_35952_c0_seq1.p1  ORF type:complete len:386 (-),score=113.05 gnl/TRDRNA2_/TRDRNA2_35952_c0_seq1:49-1134(-)
MVSAQLLWVALLVLVATAAAHRIRHSQDASLTPYKQKMLRQHMRLWMEHRHAHRLELEEKSTTTTTTTATLHAEETSEEDEQYDEAEKEAKEVEELKGKIRETSVAIGEFRRKHAAAREFHKEQKELIEEQIEIRKRQMELDEKEHAEYKKSKYDYYHTRMCSMTVSAFRFDDEDLRLELLHLCHEKESSVSFLADPADNAKKLEGPPVLGRYNLAPQKDDLPDGWDRALEVELGAAMQLLSKQMSLVMSEARVLVKKGFFRLQAPQSEDLRKALAMLENELVEVKKEYREDSRRWQEERIALRHKEKALGHEVNSGHAEEEDAKRESWRKVKAKFCPVVNKNFRTNAQAIVSYIADQCSK